MEPNLVFKLVLNSLWKWPELEALEIQGTYVKNR
jgi:hypothetical protein